MINHDTALLNAIHPCLTQVFKSLTLCSHSVSIQLGPSHHDGLPQADCHFKLDRDILSGK